MLTKIADHISQLKVPIPYDLREVNCYIVEGEKGYTIVDTGDCTEEAQALWEQMLPKDKPIEKVLLTHAHTDHIGLAGWFQRKYNASIMISDKGYEEIQRLLSMFKGDVYKSPLSELFRRNGGPTHPEEDDIYHQYEAYEFEPNILFQEGQFIAIGDDLYETIWTPGHSPDHFSFYNEQKQILFVGDHILQSLNPIVMANHMDENPLKEYLHAINRLEKLSAELVLPGHGQLIPHLTTRIANMKAHYQKRWDQILHTIDGNGMNAFQLSLIIYGENQPVPRMMSGFLQTITNLIYLTSINELKMKDIDGVIYYYR